MGRERGRRMLSVQREQPDVNQKKKKITWAEMKESPL